MPAEESKVERRQRAKGRAARAEGDVHGSQVCLICISNVFPALVEATGGPHTQERVLSVDPFVDALLI